MNLHGYLAQLHFGGDLLVQRAGDDQGQDLALAWAQQVETGLKGAHFPGLFPSHPITFEGDAHGIEQGLLGTGLVRNSTAPAFIALTLMGISPWSDDENNRNIGMCAGKLA